MRRVRWAAGGALLAAGFFRAVGADQPVSQGRPLTDLTPQELAQIEVVSAARKPRTLQRTAAAVAVITREDIHAAGVTTLADALRLAPGVEVAQIDANQWSVGVRGFGSRLSRAVLVMIDGRSVYTPLFAGTYWEVQDTILEDVDRIEVVRGPGGALWGANAVNGVINIITKRSTETQGTLALARLGSLDRTVAARHGFALSDALTASVYGKAFWRDGFSHADGREWDGWHEARAGFHADWEGRSRGSATFQGDVSTGGLGQETVLTRFEPPYATTVDSRAHVSGGNLLGKYAYAISDESDVQVQAYWDRTTRSEATFSEARDTFDVAAQHRTRLPFGQEVVSGVGWRVSRGVTEGAPSVRFEPKDRTETILNLFVQDEVTLSRRFSVIFGTKLERNHYTGFEWQPTLRLLFTPRSDETFWAAVSRAVRTPSRVERELDLFAVVDPRGPVFARVVDDGSFVSERVVAWEAGYRRQATRDLWTDVALFYNDYDRLLGAELLPSQTVPGVPGVVLPYLLANRVEGRGFGAEVSVDYSPAPRCRLSGTYSYLQVDLHTVGGPAVLPPTAEGDAPRHQGTLRGGYLLNDRLQADAFFRAVSALPNQKVPGYVTLDLKLSWHASAALELSAVGQNLLGPHHAEFAGGTPASVEVPRSAYLQARWTW